MYENKNPEKQSEIMISVKEHNEKNEIEIILGDNGPGIPEDIQKKVFDPFFTTKDIGKGTGLGLAVSYYIISGNHSGRFYFESIKDKGTTFHIFLPV
jgi:signal transduction histidine kinase